MIPFRRQLLVLITKEWSQTRRHRAAWTSGLIAPILVLVVVAAPLILLWSALPRSPLPTTDLRVIRLITSGDPLLGWIVPSLVALVGLLLPSVNAVNSVLSERERRTHELIASLPFDARLVLVAKGVVVLAVAFGQTLPFVLLDSAVIVAAGLGDLGYASSLVVLGVFAAFCATGVALTAALLTNDARTATNLVGLISAAIFVSIAAVLVATTGPLRIVSVAAGLGVVGVSAMSVGLRRQTLEAYFS